LGAIVKACFAMRVWRFSKHNWFITGSLLLLVAVQLALSVVYMWQGFRLPSFAYMGNLKQIATISLGAGTLTDILTAAALCYYLREIRTGFKETSSIINMLMVYAVNTGLVTSTVSLCTLIIYNTLSHTFIYMGFYFVLSNLYANSLLATLNSRGIRRGRGNERETGSTNTGNGSSVYMIGRLQTTPPPVCHHVNPSLKIGIDIEREVNRDDIPTDAVSWHDKV